LHTFRTGMPRLPQEGSAGQILLISWVWQGRPLSRWRRQSKSDPPEQMAQAEQIRSAPPSAVSVLLQSIIQGAQPPEPTFGGADFLSLLPESVGQLYSPEQRSRISQIQKLDSSLSRGLIEILTELAAEQSAPRVALTPAMQQAGIVGDEQGFIPLDQFGEAQRVVESLIKEETYPYPRDVVESLPFLEGKFGTL